MRKFYLFAISIAILSCKKQTETQQSSEKTLSSFVFKQTDNATLSTDVAGRVGADSVIVEFPQNTDLSHLVPTINYTGKTIEPANRTAQDFSKAISYKITADNGSTKTYSFRVNRLSADTATMVLGIWRVVKDSVANNNYANPNGGYLLPGVYTGVSQDYFKFDANGAITVLENNISGSSTYRLVSSNKLEVVGWSNQYGLGTIQTLNSADFIFFFSASSANGGSYYRKVTLHR